MREDGRKRVVIENVKPEVDGGMYPAKRAVGETLHVQADIFADGHDVIAAAVLIRRPKDRDWKEIPMRHIQNDRWEGEAVISETGTHLFSVQGWVDHFRSWRRDILKKAEAGQEVSIDILTGLSILEDALGRCTGEQRERLSWYCEETRRRAGTSTKEALELCLSNELAEIMARWPDKRFATTYGKELAVTGEIPKTLFSAWYELFPRSCPRDGDRYGTFKDCEKALPLIQRMGFDVLYLPPIHPIGKTKRKGRNNVPDAGDIDVGSPWAIGDETGGHESIHPDLGTMADFERFVARAKEHGLDVALDLAFQCSPDHPYVKRHPEWFRWRADGTVQFAENPPKKYEDIFPLNFESEKWQELWNELRDITLFWIDRGIRIFRVDNPHTKPFPFWEWLIREIKKDHPDVFFLSEAFTRPKVMYRLAKIGFAQSYSYFTWRYTKREFIQYLTELTRSEVRDYFRPNFWPNTPDILPEHLQFGGRPAFVMRLILAATLSSNYGIYGPAFELCVDEAIEGKEEYRNSEKYELKHWDWSTEKSLRPFVERINRIRRENAALQTTFNLEFLETDNEYLLGYAKTDQNQDNIIIVVANLDPFHTQSGRVTVPIRRFGIEERQPYLVHDLLSNDKYIWEGESNYVELNPHVIPANVFRIRKRVKREEDFDYFM